VKTTTNKPNLQNPSARGVQVPSRALNHIEVQTATNKSVQESASVQAPQEKQKLFEFGFSPTKRATNTVAKCRIGREVQMTYKKSCFAKCQRAGNFLAAEHLKMARNTNDVQKGMGWGTL
jgi:hypothetical protein